MCHQTLKLEIAQKINPFRLPHISPLTSTKTLTRPQTNFLCVSPHQKWLSTLCFPQQLRVFKVCKVLLAVAPPDLANTAASPLTGGVARGHGLANHVTVGGHRGEVKRSSPLPERPEFRGTGERVNSVTRGTVKLLCWSTKNERWFVRRSLCFVK